MINGLGVLGFGVGGIEAEAVMLGEPLELGTPSVVGVRLTGSLHEGVTATDLVLTLTELLRTPRRRRALRRVLRRRPLGALAGRSRDALQHVARVRRDGRAVPGRRRGAALPARDGRGELVPLVDAHCKEQGLFRRDGDPRPRSARSSSSTSTASRRASPGRARPQDRVPLADVPASFSAAYPPRDGANGKAVHDGDVVIAAITSCTNTSNPSVMVAAGLLARNAVARGLRAAPHVKTSLAPGSRVVTDYLAAAGLQEPLDTLGFQLVGYGCTTCIGNSGPLSDEISQARARRRAGGLRRALGQPQLRGPHPPARARELPRLSPARRRLRARRLDLDRPRARAARHRQRRRRRLPARPLALQRRGARGRRGQRLARAVRARVRHDLGRRRALARAAGSGGRALRRGRRTPPTCASRRSSRICSPSPRRSPTSPTRAASSCSATRSRPTTSRRPARSRATCPPAAT